MRFLQQKISLVLRSQCCKIFTYSLTISKSKYLMKLFQLCNQKSILIKSMSLYINNFINNWTYFKRRNRKKILFEYIII